MDPESLVYSPISLPGGWSGKVLTKCHVATVHGGAPLLRHAVEDWCEWLGVLVTDPQSLPGRQTLKHSDSVEVIQAQLPAPAGSNAGALCVVGKQTVLKGIVDRTLAPLRRTRARRTFDRAIQLLEAGIGTALPLALIERRGAPSTSWLVSEHLADVVDLDRIALALLPRLDRTRTRAVRNAIAHAVADIFARLRRAGLRHRDLKASNILVAGWNQAETQAECSASRCFGAAEDASQSRERKRADEQAAATPPGAATTTGRAVQPDREGPVRLYIVDLDGVSQRRPWEFNRRWRPLIRLAASLIGYPCVTRADYARCLREYLSLCGDDPAAWRPRFPQLAAAAADYAMRSRRRKSRKLDGFSAD